MRFKVYERTGIKEETKLKENQSKLIEKQNSEEVIRYSIERGKYKESCQNKYDLDLMDFEREYEKTNNLLLSYVSYEENICVLIDGYLEYFYTYGRSMTALGLRGFRKSAEKGIAFARNLEKRKKKEEKEENTVIDFVIENYDEIEDFGEEISVPDFMYLMFELGLSSRNQQECERVTTKVKTIYDELKGN